MSSRPGSPHNASQTMTTKSLVRSKTGLTGTASIAPYLTPDEVYRMAEAVADNRKGERGKLLILFERLRQTGTPKPFSLIWSTHRP